MIENVVLLLMNAQSLDQIIISASRFAQDIKEIPQRILQINKQGITISNPQTSADLLNMSGHIYIQKSQMGGGSPMIRGFSTNRVLITVDGVRYGSIKVTLEKQQGANAWLMVSLTEGKNREIRRVMEAIDLKVNRLIRLSYGPFQLGRLARGNVKEIHREILENQMPGFFKA